MQVALAQDLSAHIKRQLIFLRNSVAAYDNVYAEEAVRIGVVIRVLCHDTANSESLLTIMGREDTLPIVTTAKTVPNELIVTTDFRELMAGMTFGNKLEYETLPGDSPTIRCADWWEQPVFICNKKAYTRKDVVLAVTNKDGGAPVDDPDARRQALQECFWIRTLTHADGTKKSEPLADNYFRMLRRFAEELLCSEDFLKLVN